MHLLGYVPGVITMTSPALDTAALGLNAAIWALVLWHLLVIRLLFSHILGSQSMSKGSSLPLTVTVSRTCAMRDTIACPVS